MLDNLNLSRRNFLIRSTAATLPLATMPHLLWGEVDAAAKNRINAALPSNAPIKPAKPRKLLIFDLNIGYGGHSSIKTANTAFTRMGEKTGAFETVVTRDPAIFKRESLSQFDAVFFNNTVGNLFKEPDLRRSLIEFIFAGGGIMGVHAASCAFLDWENGGKEDWYEFGAALGGRGAAHRAADEQVFVKLDDPTHPVLATFGGKGFKLQDEFFRPQGTYSRKRNRVLMSFDLEKTDLSNEPRDGCYREDKDYAIAWVRNYGRGRVFYTTLGHSPSTFEDPKMLEFLLAGTQFVLGDLQVPTLPSALLTPALQQQEKLGWRLGVEAYTFHQHTLFETIDKTAELGMGYVGGLSFQRVSPEIPKMLAPGLSDSELESIRLKLDSSGVRLLTYYFQSIPGDEEGCRKVFEFGRKLGIETFMTEPDPASLPLIDRFCQEYKIYVALHNHDRKASPAYWSPEAVLKSCEGRSSYMGACADIGYWMRDGIDPVAGIEKLGKRLITLQLHDLDDNGADVPWGSGKGRTAEILAKIHELGVTPLMFGVEYSRDWQTNMPAVKQCAEFFNNFTMQLK